MTSTSLNLVCDKAYISLTLYAFGKYFHEFYRNPQMRFAVIALYLSLSLAAAGFSVFRFFTGFIFWDPNRSAHDLFISFSHTFAEFAARAFCVWKLFQSFNATNINYLAGEWCYTFRCCRSRKWHGSHLTLFFYVQCLIGTVSPGEYTHTHTHSFGHHSSFHSSVSWKWILSTFEPGTKEKLN